VARSEAKLAGNAEALKQLTGNNHIFTQLMDLANLDFVASAAAEVAAKFPSINVLINNAGIMACPLSRITQCLNHRWASIISATLSSPWRCCQRLAFTRAVNPSFDALACRALIAPAAQASLQVADIETLDGKEPPQQKITVF